MKQDAYLKREREKTAEIARVYQKQGYKVFANLPGYEKPYRISGFIPDIIVKTEDKVIVIEIKSSGSLETKNHAIKQLALYAKENPKTRFDIVVTNPKPICPICGKAFSSYLNLTRHMVLIDRPSGKHIQWLGQLLGQDFSEFGFGSDKRISWALKNRATLGIDLELLHVEKIAKALSRKADKRSIQPKPTYVCPICRKATTNSMNLARHMMGVADKPHIQWIESNGVSFLKSLGLRAGKLAQGSYKELSQILERFHSDSIQ
jgi:Holliday junction resolvase